MKDHIGLKIKEIREAKGLSQRDLSKAANISNSYIGMVESFRTNPSLNTLRKIARALNLEPGYFLEKKESESNFDFLDHLTLRDKEFISNKDNAEWISLMRELAEQNISPKRLRALVRLKIDL